MRVGGVLEMMEGGEGVMLGVHRMGGEMMEGKNNDRSGVRVMGEGVRGGRRRREYNGRGVRKGWVAWY